MDTTQNNPSNNSFELHLDRLPRSIELRRDEQGRALFTYLDQRRLPGELVFETTGSWMQVVDAIKTLAVRGAPAIGVSGASALAVWASDPNSSFADFLQVAETVADARPTAVNLRWAVNRAVDVVQEGLAVAAVGDAAGSDAAGNAATVSDAVGNDAAANDAAGNAVTHKDAAADLLFDLVKEMEAQDEAVNRAIGRNGANLLEPGSTVLTHCNAGSLATVFFGTALGVVYAAAEQGKIARVYSDETRPVLQGARLTCWELAQVGVPVTAICDNMAASVLAKGVVDAVIVGADRIARNGDTANKIGTYGLAICAKRHGVPFYVAAPVSTFDFTLEDGSQIPIEERAASEVLPQPIPGVDVYNPAFDVTPAELIAGIITEKGVFAPTDVCKLNG